MEEVSVVRNVRVRMAASGAGRFKHVFYEKGGISKRSSLILLSFATYRITARDGG